MKKIFTGCVIFIVLAVLLFFSARFIDKRNDSEIKMTEEAESRWARKMIELSKSPQYIQNIDNLISQKKWREARREIASLGKKDPELSPILSHREAEILYRYGIGELSNLLFFIENDMPEEMGEARDHSTKAMNIANDILDGIANSESKTVRFSANDGAGDINVRRAALAISKEELNNALSRAVEYYIAALMVRDDYETKVKLELLVDMKSQSENAGNRGKSDNLSPKDFQLVPLRRPGSGAAAGRHSKIPF